MDDFWPCRLARAAATLCDAFERSEINAPSPPPKVLNDEVSSKGAGLGASSEVLAGPTEKFVEAGTLPG
ncbi:hypothetical protein HMPREF3192_00354 [Atopobium deltae]|uniref:Uncharacterized protein n=1 Tax=Atopobium deltae TaxID=1393034 RepID=A0A133XWG8_9ACTN|nr:hypothetical protein HMPREF3192_00354 [Atopobium deltae]